MTRLTKEMIRFHTDQAQNEIRGGGWAYEISSIAHSNLVIIELLNRILETQNNIDKRE